MPASPFCLALLSGAPAVPAGPQPVSRTPGAVVQSAATIKAERYFFISLALLFEQAVRTLVTLVAACELAQHLDVVRFTMTILALRNHGMLVGMAENTLEPCMLGGAGLKAGPDVLMTCAAGKIGNVGAVGKGQGLMDLMTHDAVLKFLLLHMGFVAVQAVRLVTVFVMAEGAVNRCMGARSSSNLFDDFWMTGVAGGPYIARKGNIQGLVRVGMAAKAVFKREVGLSLMTGGTLGDQ